MGCQVPDPSESSLTFVPSPPHPTTNLCVRIIGKGKEQKQKKQSRLLFLPAPLPPSLSPSCLNRAASHSSAHPVHSVAIQKNGSVEHLLAPLAQLRLQFQVQTFRPASSILSGGT